jgi:hypothetical protein
VPALIIELTTEKWVDTQPTDLRKCKLCEETIYSDMNILTMSLFVGQKLTNDIPIASFCNACIYEVKKEFEL